MRAAFERPGAVRSARVLVLGAGLSGLAAAERLLDAGAEVVVVDSFPVPGGRVASFAVSTPVAGLIAGDVVEHGLHAWFQHYHQLFGLMARAGVTKPPLTTDGVCLWNCARGHFAIEGGPLFWLINALRLPEPIRGPQGAALWAFARLVGGLRNALGNPERTDSESAGALLTRFGVSAAAIEHVFRPCLFSLTSLPVEELSALEMLRWMSNILPDPRIRCLQGGSTQVMCTPIAEYLRARGAELRFGIEARRLWLDAGGRVKLSLAQAPDRTGVRHILVPGFQPAEPPDPDSFDGIVCTLPWQRLLEISRDDAALLHHESFSQMRQLENLHPLTIRLWFEQPIEGGEEHYILTSDTLFDVVRPTPEPERYRGTRLIDALIENVETHLPSFTYRGERYLEDGPELRGLVERVLTDLERMYPGQIRGNRLLRQFLHVREGIVACRPGVWRKRPAQHIGLRDFVLAGDWTRQATGVCMEGAVRSGQLAAQALLAGRPIEEASGAFDQTAYSLRSVFERDVIGNSRAKGGLREPRSRVR
jgi:15-cis-phytoene desaturase